jgi:prepilin-type N-terminal cleavage/methylation domain-containing protein
MRARRHPIRARAGFTLIECMIALAILALGSIATAQLVTILSRSNATIGASTDAVALATTLIAEINDARFVRGGEDPGLVVGNQTRSEMSGTVTAPVAGSTILAVGSFPSNTPQYAVSYEVRWCQACRDPFGTGQEGLGGVDVLITVSPVANEGHQQKLLRPVHFVVRKEYAPTAAGSDPRGW